jgi:TRAP-type C4-dicarboxylate transport system permease large subunit
VVGCFLDAIPAIIIVGTILQPIAAAAGLHPVHFAMVSIMALAFGLVTPPYGLCLLICCSIAKLRLIDVLKDVCIMLLPMLGVLSLLALIAGFNVRLAREGGRSIQAATGMFYLAVILAPAVEFAAKVRFF